MALGECLDLSIHLWVKVIASNYVAKLRINQHEPCTLQREGNQVRMIHVRWITHNSVLDEKCENVPHTSHATLHETSIFLLDN